MDKISFWQLLEGNKVVIPIIQRDYAQGRIGKEHIREKFLTQIKAALEDRKNSGELDFVYGTTKKDVFYPLDGQQRLTTLWLLHWFVASKAGKLDEAKERLKKFSYETRTSSREFCEKLCGFDISKVSKVSVAIQKQTWFYTAWKQDPTIQSMLRMIEGTDIKNKKGNDFSDGIEEVFKCYDGDHLECRLLQCQYIDYWEKLTGIDCPIKFSKLKINSSELPVSDDLYIKMNARGKPLTDFENFKADLIASLKNDDAIKYGGLIDNNWTNHFWNSNEIDFFDAKWMAFLCRFAVCVRIENEEDSNEKVANVLKEWSVYKNDTDKSFSYAYKDFRDFKGVFNAGVLNRLNDIFEGWSKLSNLNDFTLDSSWEDKFCFIPSGNKNQAVSTLTMKTRVLFYGTMLFCEKLHFCKECGSFKDCLIGKWNAWKRVMWNLAENTNESSTLEGFVGVIKMFKQLGEGCLDIYTYLNEDGNKVEYKFEQLKEEIEKAKKIHDAPGSSDWENKIIQAENHAFFHGAIRFLFHDQTGNVKWDDFDTKCQNANKYFDQKGVSQAFRNNALLLRAFLARLGESNLTEKFWFGNGADFWRDQVLLNAEFNSVVSELLLTGITHDNAIPEDAPAWIADNTLLSCAIEKDHDSKGNKDPYGKWHIITDWFRRGSDDKTLTRYSNRIKGNVNSPWQIIPLCNLSRNELFDGLESEQRRGKCYFIGWTSDVNFLFNDRWFKWRRAVVKGGDYIYLLKNDWKNQSNPYEQHQEDPSKQGDEQTCYCFELETDETKDNFMKKLNAVIENAGKQSPVLS